MKVVTLLSGGMDSVCALYEAAAQGHDLVAALSFDYGSKHNHREIPMARWHANALGIRHEIVALDFMNRLFQSDLLNSGGSIPEGHYEEA
ncbi:MAG: 7-cyano-7-deazaguanine synthase, partial [Verrucomicrobiae bacterium]|nr:7-cyano-7-deazaguanine synthase [Verrucomicrobiae bacterium]